MGLCGTRRWPASPDIGPLVHMVYSVKTTSHIQKNERGVCEPHGRLVTISLCLIRFVPDYTRNHAVTDETIPLLLVARAWTHTESSNVTGRPCGSVAQWIEYSHGLREVLGSSPGRAMCLCPSCDIWWPLWGWIIGSCLDCACFFFFNHRGFKFPSLTIVCIFQYLLNKASVIFIA